MLFVAETLLWPRLLDGSLEPGEVVLCLRFLLVRALEGRRLLPLELVLGAHGGGELLARGGELRLAARERRLELLVGRGQLGAALVALACQLLAHRCDLLLLGLRRARCVEDGAHAGAPQCTAVHGDTQGHVED
eukprot:6093287-Pleurochrysis_carterae.AAC.2